MIITLNDFINRNLITEKTYADDRHYRLGIFL